MEERAYSFSNYNICSLTGAECQAGVHFLNHLKHNLSALDAALDDNFELSGSVCLSECSRDCTAAFHCSKQAICMLGGIGPEENVDELVTEFSKTNSWTDKLSDRLQPYGTFMRLDRRNFHHC